MTEIDPKLAAIESSTPDLVTYIIDKEDHTLGNALRYVLMRQPETEFCGYSVPHPSESRINIRLQTNPGTNAHDVMQKSLEDLAEISDIILDRFDHALEAFDRK